MLAIVFFIATLSLFVMFMLAAGKQEMSLKKTNGVGLKKEENITQARSSTCK